MPNPSPVQNEKLKAKQFRPVGEVPGNVPLARKATYITLPIDVHEALEALPKEEKITWLRQLITDAARKELIKN